MSKSISIPILGDNLYEAKESFYVDITEAIGATIVQNGAEGYRNNWVVVNIGNDDVSSTPPNNAPTLSSLGNSVKTTTEDKAVSISFAELAGKGNEVDVDGIVTSFVVKAVSSGTLKIGTTAATATAWSAANSTIDATKSAFWTPAANANGTLDAFTALAKDNLGLESASAVQASVTVTAVNDRPTLSTFGTSVKTTTEDKAVSISFAELAGKGNEVDVDGIVTSFVVKALSSGTLKIGTTAATATAWNATINNIIDATKSAFWTPAANANGTLNAFTAVAKDNGGLESATAIQTKVAVTPVSDVFKFSSLSNLGVAGSPTAINGFVTSKASSNLNWRDKLDLTSIDAIPGGSDNPFQFSSTAPSTASNSGWIGKLWVTAAPDGALVNLSTDNDSSPEYQIKLIGVSPANVAAIDFSL